MNYIELNLNINADFAEILVAELAEIQFDSFIENEGGLLAYIEEDAFSETEPQFKQLMEKYATKTPLVYAIKKIAKQNWNKEWESNFSPINVDDTIFIRASFHQAAETHYKYEIIITPKMSFGTGHHETTAQMLALQLKHSHQNKSVLDVGTGTGILAIMAEKLGAASVHAFDIDEWSVENTLENIELNHCEKITVKQGTIAEEEQKEYDIVLANINRNIILDELEAYVSRIKKGGLIFMSGFYENDLEDIENKATGLGLEKVEHTSKNNWVAVVFSKQ